MAEKIPAGWEQELRRIAASLAQTADPEKIYQQLLTSYIRGGDLVRRRMRDALGLERRDDEW